MILSNGQRYTPPRFEMYDPKKGRKEIRAIVRGDPSRKAPKLKFRCGTRVTIGKKSREIDIVIDAAKSVPGGAMLIHDHEWLRANDPKGTKFKFPKRNVVMWDANCVEV